MFCILDVVRLDLLMGSYYLFNVEVILRFFIMLFSVLLYVSLNTIMINRRIYFITRCGELSLYIFMLHRIPSLLISDYFYIYKSFIMIAIMFTILICLFVMFIYKYLDFIIDRYLMRKSTIFLFGVLFFMVFVGKSGNYEFSLSGIKKNKEIVFFENKTRVNIKFDDLIIITVRCPLKLCSNKLTVTHTKFFAVLRNLCNLWQKIHRSFLE